MNRPCTLIQRLASSTSDDYGNEIPDEAEVETFCELQQRSREEPVLEGQNISATEWRVFFRPGLDVQTGDALIVEGAEYELVGEPWVVRNPRTGTESHIEASVELVEGEVRAT